MSVQEIEAAERAEIQVEIARHARLLRLAEQNGFDCDVREPDFMPGKWWYVPREFVPIVGCMAARVE